jgi:hypothetical protein
MIHSREKRYNRSVKWAARALFLLLACMPASVFAASVTALPPIVTQKQPASGTHLRTYFPVVSATLERADPKSVHLFVDGRDITASASMTANSLRYVPRERVGAGWHDVFLEGTGQNNRAFSDAWVFETLPPDEDGFEPAPFNGFEFVPVGGPTFFPGGFMHFFFVAPFEGFAELQLCGLGTFPFQQQPFSPVFFTTVLVPVTPINAFLNCQVSALFTPFGGFETVLVPLPVSIGFFSHGHHLIVNPATPALTYGTPSMRSTMPVYRMPEPSRRMPGETVAPGVMNVTPRTVMPIYRAVPLPGTSLPARTQPGARPISGPRPIPAVRPVTMPHSSVPIPH